MAEKFGQISEENRMPGDARIALGVPAYNAARFLSRLFESVAAQTMPFDEIWVYDDYSSDDTAEVAKSFGAQVMRGEANKGCPAAKNALLEQVSCEWVHFHDVDDVMSPEYVARAKARIGGRNSFDVLMFDYEVIQEETGVLLYEVVLSHSTLLDDPVRYMLANTVHHNCGVYSVSLLRAIGGFGTDPGVYFNEERDLHLRLAEKGARFTTEAYTGSRILQSRTCAWETKKIECCMAFHGITRNFAVRYPGRYQNEIADCSWQAANVLAPLLELKAADECLSLACANGGRIPRHGGLDFKALCAIDPYLAIRLREFLVRLFKPHLRTDYPGLRLKMAGSQG